MSRTRGFTPPHAGLPWWRKTPFWRQPTAGPSGSVRCCHGAGFTLVEIMIVASVIATLAAIAIPAITRGRTAANEAAAVGDTRALIGSLQMFWVINMRYPDDAAGAWQTQMYTTANPDFGPASFDLPMDGVAATSARHGYVWLYTGVAGGRDLHDHDAPTHTAEHRHSALPDHRDRLDLALQLPRRDVRRSLRRAMGAGVHP